MLHFDKNLNFLKVFVNKPGNGISLSNDAVLNIIEDSKKRIWVGTFRGGLSKYDRNTQTFKNYINQKENSNSIPRNDIRKIAEDNDGNLWLAVHGKGASCFNPETETFTNYLSLSNAWTYDLLIDKNGSVWTSSVNGISRKKKNEASFQNFHYQPDTNEQLINDFGCLYEDHTGQIWIESVHGLYRFSDKSKLIIPLKTNTLLDNVAIKTISQDSRENFYFSTNRGLFKYNPHTKKIDHFDK